MSALQIRKLPDDIYQALAYRAELSHRSLAQQTVYELRQAVASPNVNRRAVVLARIQHDMAMNGTRTLPLAPERALRADRGR